MNRHRESPSVERKIRIELLRSQAAIERQTIAIQAQNLKSKLDPREQIMSMMPTSGSGLLAQIGRAAIRYPYLASTGSTLLLSQFRNPRRLLLGGAVGLIIWAVSKRKRLREETSPPPPPLF